LLCLHGLVQLPNRPSRLHLLCLKFASPNPLLRLELGQSLRGGSDIFPHDAWLTLLAGPARGGHPNRSATRNTCSKGNEGCAEEAGVAAA